VAGASCPVRPGAQARETRHAGMPLRHVTEACGCSRARPRTWGYRGSGRGGPRAG
jgi:hypothetical protein